MTPTLFILAVWLPLAIVIGLAIARAIRRVTADEERAEEDCGDRGGMPKASQP